MTMKTSPRKLLLFCLLFILLVAIGIFCWRHPVHAPESSTSVSLPAESTSLEGVNGSAEDTFENQYYQNLQEFFN